MIPDERAERTERFGEKAVLPALREAFSKRPDWQQFSPHQLSVLMFLYGFSTVPLEEFDIESALPFALEDWEGVA